MHERFKKEVNEHIQHCMMTKEGLEAHQVELRAAAKKLSMILFPPKVISMPESVSLFFLDTDPAQQ